MMAQNLPKQKKGRPVNAPKSLQLVVSRAGLEPATHWLKATAPGFPHRPKTHLSALNLASYGHITKSAGCPLFDRKGVSDGTDLSHTSTSIPMSMFVICPRCEGAGLAMSGIGRCSTCSGTGAVSAGQLSALASAQREVSRSRREFRMSLELDQAQMADLMGMSAEAYFDYERGKEAA